MINICCLKYSTHIGRLTGMMAFFADPCVLLCPLDPDFTEVKVHGQTFFVVPERGKSLPDALEMKNVVGTPHHHHIHHHQIEMTHHHHHHDEKVTRVGTKAHTKKSKT